MDISVYGTVDEESFKRILKDISLKVSFPPNLSVYTIGNLKDCNELLKAIPKDARKEAARLCVQKIPFSYSKGRKSVMMLPVKKGQFSPHALKGLFLHELVHIQQKKKGLNKEIEKTFSRVWSSKYKLFEKLPYSKVKLSKMLIGVGKFSQLLLKDLYVNSFLINKGCGRYLVDYYVESFAKKKTCPRQVLYTKFKKAAQKDIQIIGIALAFEFSLFAIILPFQRSEFRKARKLRKQIDSCYRLNSKEISRKYKDLVNLYLKDFGKKDFDEKFFSQVFDKVYFLLK